MVQAPSSGDLWLRWSIDLDDEIGDAASSVLPPPDEAQRAESRTDDRPGHESNPPPPPPEVPAPPPNDPEPRVRRLRAMVAGAWVASLVGVLLIGGAIGVVVVEPSPWIDRFTPLAGVGGAVGLGLAALGMWQLRRTRRRLAWAGL